MKFIYSLFATTLFTIFSFQALKATTISPFPNLGEMAKASPAVVLAKAERNFTFENGRTTRFRTSLKVLEHIKGSLAVGDHFVVQNFHAKVADMERAIWGDLELEEGKSYLLFLNPMDDDLWQTTMLSYASFEEHSRNDESLLVPFDLGTEVHFHLTADQAQPEPLAVYSTNNLISLLRNVLNGTQTWDKEKVATPHAPNSFEAGFRGVPPGHCSFLSGTPYARWPDFETTSLPVRYHTAGDPGCATTAAEIAAAIGNITTNYAGVNVASAGTHAFVPTCGGGEGATDNEFTTWVSANLGGTRHHLIQFDDPCSQIADLVACNGTLAIGGLYWFSSTHMADGMSWRNAAYGYIVVNNGTGACQCTGGTDYEIMMTHELTHSLNIGHIAGMGTANMNPSCCNAISALDIACLDFIYAPAAAPVEVIGFTGIAKEKTILLDWTTTSETENDFFFLEKLNEQDTYTPLAKVDGAGTSFQNLSYQFTDTRPETGTNYYRLSQSDFDGSTKVIDQIAIDYYNDLEVNIRPNPLKGDLLQIASATEASGDLEIEIFDLTGQAVFQSKEKMDRGKHQSNLDLGDLPQGLYIFKATQNNQTKTMRFVKT